MIIAASCLCVRGSGEYLKTTPPYTKIKPQQLQDVNYFQNKSKSHAFYFLNEAMVCSNVEEKRSGESAIEKVMQDKLTQRRLSEERTLCNLGLW